ncbi:MAG: hypothetical protein Q9O62_06355 [Ardenticatenia bacterium]|nr:hypothetical protein [Ardenticatenia bacterium]
MELRAYVAVVRRRWWVLIFLPALVLIMSLLTYTPPVPSYQYVIRLVVGVEPLVEGERPLETDPRLAAAQASEYIADDLSVIVGEAAFAEAVNARLPQELRVPPGALAGSTVAEKQHRILTVTITWGRPEQLERIGDAVVQTLREEAGRFLPLAGGERTQVAVIGAYGPFPLGLSLRQKVEIPLRALIALAAAVVIVFTWDYLDDTVRTREEARHLLNAPVLAEIPRRRRFPWWPIRRP